MEAAKQAGTRAMEMTEDATNDWAEVINDETLSRNLPTMTLVSDKDVGVLEDNGYQMEGWGTHSLLTPLGSHTPLRTPT